jgi:hypothetical protein
MGTEIRLVNLRQETSFVPLGVLGYCLVQTHFFAPVFADLCLPLKTVEHDPPAKLLDLLVSILTGCRSIAQVNTRLRPDQVLAHAWGRPCFAEQSTLTRTLDAFGELQVAQLRQGSEALLRRESRTLQHDFTRDLLWLDIDLTPLPVSRHAEGSTKGKIGERKNRYGRQLARVHAPQYHETLFSQLYPGKQHSNPVYLPVLKGLQAFMGFTELQRQKTILRSDSGFGSDYNLDTALDQGWQVLSKSYGGRRAARLAHLVAQAEWQVVGPDRWVTQAVDPPTYLRPVQQFVLRWKTEQDELKHSHLVCSLPDWCPEQVVAAYDERGQCETEIQADKAGLKMVKRRKMHLAAQEALILLTDLAHNTLAWTSDWMFAQDRLSDFGTTRLIEDVLCIPGRLRFEQGRLVEVQLNRQHPYAEAVKEGLERLLHYFGDP